MPKHLFYSEGIPHSCNDWGECNLCVLSCCSVCGGMEGSLTTDCPGERVTHSTSDKVYTGRLDYRDASGGWVNEFGPCMRGFLYSRMVDHLRDKSGLSDASFSLSNGLNREEFADLKKKVWKSLMQDD